MGIIQVPGRLSGRTYNIEIEGDTPTAAEQERIRAGVEERESRFVQRYEATMGKPLAEPDDGTALGRGFERGKAGAKSVLGTTIETIGQQVGLPSIAEYGRGMEEAAAQRQFELSFLQPKPTTRQDVAAAEGFFPTIGAGLSYAGEIAGEQIPQLGVGLAGGAAGAVAGGLAAGPAGALTGFGVGSGLMEAPMLFGANVQRQEEEVAAGRKEAVDLTDALGATVGQSALTAVTNALAGAGVFLRPGAKLFTRVVSGAAVGGTTESLNEIGQQMLERQQAGLPVDSEDAIQEYIDAGIAGGVLGLGAGGIGGVAGPRVTEEAPAPAPEGKAPPETPPEAAPEIGAEPEVDIEEVRANAEFTYAEQRAAALKTGAPEPEAQRIAAQATLDYIADLPPAAQTQMSDFIGTLSKQASPVRGIRGAMPPDLPDSAYAADVVAPRSQRTSPASVPAEMRPSLPDSAYAPEFGAATQKELFDTAAAPAAPAPQPTVELPGIESEADAFERAAALYAPKTRTAAPVVKAPEPKPEQVLTDDLVTQLGVGPAKSASLRKLVGKPLQDTKVIKALDSWAQNPKTTPDQKALASSLITGQPVQKDLLAAPEAETTLTPEPEVTPLTAETEAQDVTTTAETQPEEVGAGVPSGGQGVEGLGQPAGDTQPTEEPAAPAGGGLGGDLSVPVGADTAAGAERDTLSQLEARLSEARARAAELRKKVPAGVLQRELVAGGVDPRLPQIAANLQEQIAKQEKAVETAKAAVPKKPTHPARPKKMEAYEFSLAVLRDLQDRAAIAQDTLSAAELKADLSRTAQTKAPITGPAAKKYTDYVNALRQADVIRQELDTERARVERTKTELDRAAEAAAVPAPPPSLTRPVIPLYRMGPGVRPTPMLQKGSADAEIDKVLADRYAAVTPVNVKIGAQLLNEAGMKLGVKDPLTVADKRIVLSLLATREGVLSPQAAAAKLYFSKVLRPIDAILMVVDDLTAPYGKYRAEPGTDAAYKDFFSGTGRTAAKQALEFIRARMSPAVQNELDFRIALSEQQNKNQETWLADLDRVELKRKARLEAKAARAEAAKESGYIVEDMSTDPLAALDRELHYSVKMALDGGNLRLALRALSATTNNKELAKLAARFADMAGTTRVKVLYPGDSSEHIGQARGRYWGAGKNAPDERRNFIYINGQTGMDAHVLMHEMAHAVTVELAYTMPNHPVVKQLEALLKDLKSRVGRDAFGNYPDEFYGLKDLPEFLAEVFGRVAFGENDNGLRDLMARTTYPTEAEVQREVPLTFLQKASEIITNLMRAIVGLPSKRYPRKTKTEIIYGKETAMDQFQRLVEGMLSTAPDVLPAEVFQRARANVRVGQATINNALQSAPAWDKAGLKRLSNMMQASIPMPVRRALLGLLQLDWFNDLAGKYFPEIAELKALDDLRRGEIVNMEERAKGVIEDLLNYANKQPELYSTLMSIMGRATLEEVDPTKPLSQYAGDADKSRVWNELNIELQTKDSTGEMRRHFKTVRNMFAQFREDIKAVLSERVKEITDDKVKQNQIVSRLLQKLDEEKAIDPYFSLMRKGEFWLTYNAEDTTAPAVLDATTGKMKRPPTQFVQAFHTVWERDQFRRKLEATTDADGQPVAWEFEEKPRPRGYNPDERVPTAFAQGAINIVTSLVPNMVDKGKGDAAVDAIMDMFSRFTPEHSILQSFNKRKGVRGFMGDITPLGVVDRPTDMVQALAEKSSSLAYQLANMKYGARIQALKNRSETTLKNLLESPSLTAGEKQAVLAYHEEFKERATFAQNPRVSQTAQAARGITFGMTLGFSVAAALNNLMQIPMIGTTELAGRYGMGASVRELGSAARFLMNAGKTKKVRSFGPDGMELREFSSADDFGSLGNYFEVNDKGEYVPRTDKTIPKGARAKLANMDVLVEVLSANGMLTNSMAQEMLDAEAGLLQRINQWSGFLMHQAERFNRQAMAIAAYNLELGKVSGPISREAKLAAAKKAIEITERVNGSIGASTAPRFAQTAIGSVMFMFKRFGLHMARYIIGTANQALRGASKEDRAVARYQIIGMLGTTALFAGVQGLPFFGELMSLFNLLFTDDDEEPAEVVIEKFLQEPFYHGALNYLTGAEIASRISMSGLIFRENKIEKDQSSLYDLFEMIGGPAVGVYMNTERGIDLISQGELYRGIEAMMPSIIKGGMKATRFAFDGATTLRGDEVVPVSNLDIALQALGYTPGAYAREQERVSGEKRIDEAVRSKKRDLLRKYNLAMREGDIAEAREVIKDMQEFSREYPEDAITGDTLSRSYNSFMQRSEEMLGGASFTPTGRNRAIQSFSEYDDDISIWSD